ncbi:MAG TPA: hypothetical protein DDX92_12410 [Flavobacteriales bacterium]|nr:hypothetical protein [Flavobacteriales bacterium]
MYRWNYKKFSIRFGLLLWLIAILIFRFSGNLLFGTNPDVIAPVLYIGIIPILYFLTRWMFTRYKLKPEKKLKSVILLALPGLVLSACCILLHRIIFPNLGFEQTILLGSWFLWVHAITLLLGIAFRDFNVPDLPEFMN